MKIAIVGTGVSGLVAAHLLHREHEITVYEAGGRIGGHSHTVEVESGAGSHWIDTGFIVFNDRNYPNFERLLEELEVPSQPSHMGFSVSDGRGGFEYSGTCSAPPSSACCATGAASTARRRRWSG
jgi:predicted NAD/FAD-binding protein